jgi:uncharacterized membrane protein YgcG
MSQHAPNPQLNLALSIVAPVIMLIAVAVLWFTKPVVTPPAAPTAVNTTATKLPDAGTVYANALPNAGSAPAGGGAGPAGGGAPAFGPTGFSAAGGGGARGGGGKPMARGAG